MLLLCRFVAEFNFRSWWHGDYMSAAGKNSNKVSVPTQGKNSKVHCSRNNTVCNFISTRKFRKLVHL